MQEARAFDLAVIHLTFEGIQTYGGGVATVTRGHLAALPRLKSALAEQGIRLTPYFCEIAYAPTHERRDPDFQQKAEQMLVGLGGQFAYLINFTTGLLPKAPWGVGDLGGLENWKVACASGAGVALNFARRHTESIVYCHDTLFALAPMYLTVQEEAARVNATAIYVVHSTALTHELPLPNPERLMVEGLGVQWAKITPRCRIGSISRFIAEHLQRDYGARPEDIVPTGNGINPADPYFRIRSRDEILAKLHQYGIPDDRPLVFSWGRNVEYKRYDIVLKAAAKLAGAVHPVIMVTPNAPALETLSQELRLATTFIFAFDPELVACILQWERTQAAASLAYLEPFGLTPIEVRALARKQGALMVVSNTGGLVEQVEDGVDGFVTRQDDPDDVARVFRQILARSEGEKEPLRRAGLQKVLSHYTWSTQILATLAATVPQIAAVGDRVRQSLVQESLAVL